MGMYTPLGPNKSLRFAAVERALKECGCQPRRILEVGCGQGAFATRLVRGAEYVGLEPDYNSFKIARERLLRLGRGEVLNIEFEDFHHDEAFDLVCAFEVLEHMVEDRSAIASWITMLQPDGLLLVSTPADEARYTAYDKYVGHIRRYEPHHLRDLLASEGLHDVEVTRYGFPFYNFIELMYAVIAGTRLRHSNQETAHDRTRKSGGVFVAPDALLRLGGVLAAALVFSQARFPGRGPGLIAYGRKPA